MVFFESGRNLSVKGWSETGKIGVAVVGCGFWGRQHVRVLSSLKNVAVEAVADIDPGKVNSVANEYGISKAYTDNSRLLEDP